MEIKEKVWWVSVVGSAGRDPAEDERISKDLFHEMKIMTIKIIQKHIQSDLKTIKLVSGGAALADHVAVSLFIENQGFEGLTLHLPTKWESNLMRYYDSGEKDFRSNPGRTANKFHEKFSKLIGIQSLEEVEKARLLGAQFHIWNGFHARNTKVAKCDLMIAFTWSKTDIPPHSGGTIDTWNKSDAKMKVHIPLWNLLDIVNSKISEHK
jgi:hypothetical protein